MQEVLPEPSPRSARPVSRISCETSVPVHPSGCFVASVRFRSSEGLATKLLSDGSGGRAIFRIAPV